MMGIYHCNYQLVLTTSLPFVHTAHRSYLLNDLVKCSDCVKNGGSPLSTSWEVHWTLSFRGRRSRNKVTVGEPAIGSLIAGFCFLIQVVWVSIVCNLGACGVSLGERVWCLSGWCLLWKRLATFLVAYLEFMPVVSCTCKRCLCLSHPFLLFPLTCFLYGVRNLVAQEPPLQRYVQRGMVAAVEVVGKYDGKIQTRS